MNNTFLLWLKRIPILGPTLVRVNRLIFGKKNKLKFESSAQYWNDRYCSGGTSGAGSYGRLSKFKANFLNNFVRDKGIESVVEYGCGDGAQLALAIYPEYVGFDVSPVALEICRKKFQSSTPDKYEFFHTNTIIEKEGDFDLAISLDVIYHLVEDDAFDCYMKRLFNSSRKYVVIYLYNFEKNYESPHERGREFLKWCHDYAPNWKLMDIVKNPYSYNKDDPNNTSQSDFFIFQKIDLIIS